MNGFSPPWVSKCAFKTLGPKHYYLHRQHLFDFSARANELSNQHLPGLTFHTLCICATSLHCGWAYGSSEFHFDQLFLIIGTRVGLLSSVHKQMSAQGSRIAEWLFALCSSTVWLFITVNEYVLFQFSSLCEWLVALCTNVGIPPVWKSIWVLRFPAWLNDFLHSVYLCGFSPLHCGWACIGLCDCVTVALVAFVWILSSVCFGVISHERLFRWESCIGWT